MNTDKKKYYKKNNNIVKKKMKKDSPQWREKLYIKYKSLQTFEDLVDMAIYINKNPKLISTVHKNIKDFVNQLSIIEEDITKLNEMIGMKNVKEHMFFQLIYIMKHVYDDKNFFLNTVIYGDPGLGKSNLIKILSSIYSKLNFVEKYNNIVHCKRSDLIGEYLGQTAMKTQNVINKAMGGILVIDEVYSLGCKNGNDSYSKECIDTLNQNLTESRNFICIIAGYEDCINENFFSLNQGLRRRFPFYINLEKYSYEELRNMLLLKINESKKWKIKEPLNENLPINFLKDDIEYFKNYGGDIEHLLLICKMKYSYLSLKYDLHDNINNYHYLDKNIFYLALKEFKERKNNNLEKMKYNNMMYI